ncbi:hypothetical protein QQS21_005508 [Conoideocrella luteorostrata]|uniref:Uncharacterized protein n=1 Tax=Conoideocrella luteorostrata TaxID=1105319 RepID=A0AAJ0CPI3_9HYPO|nr:hypothetical protein QQS21_005508 [Conoideocrella luteorostrata]
MITPGALLSLSPSSNNAQEWDQLIMKETSRTPALEHAFRALSALYWHDKAPYRSNQNYLSALTRNITAIGSFHRSFVAARQQSWVASLVFVMVMVAFQTRVIAIGPNDNCIFESVVALRCAAHFAQTAAPAFIESQWVERQRSRQNPSDRRDDPPDSWHSPNIRKLNVFVNGMARSDAWDDTHSQAALMLKTWVNLTQGRPRTWSHIVWWPASISQEFVQRLQQREPCSLVIVLYWCAFMQYTPSSWFVKNWIFTLVKDAMNSPGVGEMGLPHSLYHDLPEFGDS